MSDGKVSLEFLGEQMFRMQADLRGVRSEQVKLESEQANMQAEMSAMRNDISRLDGKVESLDGKVDALDVKIGRVDKKIDNLVLSVDARFDQVHQTMATNLDVMMKAFEASKR